jgi:hypothetical protein
MAKSSSSRKKNARGRQNGAANNSFTHNASAVKAEFTDVITPFCVNSISRTAEFHKNAVSVAAEQTGEWIAACQDVMSHLPMSPPRMFFDLAAEAVQISVETQKSAVDFVVEQTEALAEIAKDRAEAYSKVAAGASSAFQATLMRSVEAQKRVLESASEQNKATFAATRRRVGDGPSSVLVDSFERGADTILRTQKSILEATTHPFTAAKE